MSAPIITVEGLGKRYRLGARNNGERYTALRDVIADKARSLFSNPQSAIRTGSDGQNDFWALKDVAFEVNQGEVVGIIGRNGAGKSTLLKILSRITDPTAGRVRIKGRIASLLEVGTGFHPELTGRENIFLNGAILGMSKAEVKAKFDEIVAFAEVEKFLDTPIKRYSSGMYVRLAFAVAAHLEPEILIVDEVLAVGDVQFQKKCLEKMEDVALKQRRTVLFVSHSMAAVRSLCTSAILLEGGQVVTRAAVGPVVERYLNSAQDGPAVATWPDLAIAPGDDVVRLTAVRVECEDLPTARVDLSHEVVIIIEYTVLKPHPNVAVSVHFNYNASCAFVGGNDSTYHAEGNYCARCRVPEHLLNNGRYSITVFLITDATVFRCVRKDVVSFDVDETESTRREYLGDIIGFVRPRLEWKTEFLGCITVE